MSKLDFVITHYNEPWEVGKKLFDSIAMQECWSMDDLHVVLVQDGADNALPWDDLLGAYPFHVDVITLNQHCGVGSARNAGIDNAKSEWIMFMDFDDMLADIASLAMLLRVFPVSNDIDMIWSKYIREGNDYGRYTKTTINCTDELDFRTIGKAYRVSFLNDHNIRFMDDYPEYCDMVFNVIVLAEICTNSIRSFYAPFYPFYKKLRMDGSFSTLSTIDAKANHQFERDTLLVEEMRRRGKKAQYNEWLIRTVADAYNMPISVDMDPGQNHGITDRLIMFWKSNRDYIKSISEYDAEVVRDQSQSENMSLILHYYNYYEKEYYLQNDMITYDEFVQTLDQLCDASPSTDPIVIPYNENDILNERKKTDERVVVYCGTKEVYVSMIASAKSLLATTHVDKVYFLIEDDVFPYDLPDVIETINVSNTGLFNAGGPNYNNVWTYMCLMRTVFPMMFPQHDKVLSLDIDVVVTEDIGDLWDYDISDYYIAGVEEQGRVKEIGNELYVNFGVIMMNLKKLRDDGMSQVLIDAVNTEHFGCPEQDAFNRYCRGHILKLPNDFNVTVYSHITGEATRERILHYAGLKYWKHFGPVKKYNQLTWSEIMKLQGETHA